MRKIYRKTIHDPAWQEIASPSVGCWQFYIAPTDKELIEISTLTNVPMEVIRESYDDPFEYPRIEKENGSVFLVFRVPVKTDIGATTEPMLFISTDTYIISVVHSERQFTARLLEDRNLVSTQKTNFLLRILLHVINSYEHYLRDINKQILRTKVTLRTLRDDDIVTLVELGETLTNFHSALVPLNAVFEKIASGKVLPLFEKDTELLDDLKVGGQQILEWSKVNLKSAIGVREAHSTLLANRLNQTIKILSSITIIVTIPNIIAGLFGMNVLLPFAQFPFAFGIVLVIAGALVLLAFAIFRKKKWL